MSETIKCERCLRFRPFGRYTHFEVKEVSYNEARKNKDGSTTVVAHRKDIGEKRALCEDCMAETAKVEYDKKATAPKDELLNDAKEKV